MSNNAQSKITVTFEGVSQSLDQALKGIHTGLASTSTEATVVGDKLAKMSDGEAKAGKEARNLSEAIKIAADEVGLLGIESGESYIKLQSLRHGATDLTAAFGGLKAGLIGGIGLGAAFAGASFLKEAVVDSIAGEQATNQLQAALRKTPGAFHETNRAIEESSTTWAKFGVSVGVLKAAVAQGVGAGIKPETIIGQPSQIADLAKALGEDIPSALGEIERGGRGADRVISRLNLSLVDQRRAMQQLANPNFSANDRTQFLLNLVQKTSFAGQGAAGTKGAQGQIVAFDASLANLKETVGTGILPVFTDMISSFSGLIQGANQMLSAVGGLSTFLQATWKPALIGISTIFLGLKISHSALGDFIRSRLLGDVSAASGGFAEEAVQATKAGDAIAAIPPVVRTMAIFTAAEASTLKDLYLANLSRIPGALIPGMAITPQPVTVPEFVPTGAEANLAHYKGELATVPATVTTTASFAGAVLPTLAVTAVATVATIAVMDGALKPVMTALGNLTGHVTSLVEDTTAPAVNVAGHVASWVYDTPIAPSSIVAHIKSWALDTPLPDPQAVAVHVGSWIMDALPQPAAVPGHIGTWLLDQPLPDPKAVSAHIGQWVFDSLPGTVENLTGSIKHWYTSPGPSLKDLTATITHWAFGGDAKKGVTVPGTARIGSVAMKAGVIASIDGTFNVGRVVLPKSESVTVSGTGKMTSIDLPKGTTFTATGKGDVTSLTVKKGTTIQVGGAAEIDSVRVKQGLTISNVRGTVQIDNATVAPGKKLTVGNVGGTAIIDNVIPAPGKHLTISGVKGSAEIDGVTLKKGATVHVSGGSATVDTVNANAIHVSAGAISGAVGFGKDHPLPLYFQPELAPGAKWPTGPGSGGSSGGGGGGTDWTGMIESAVIFQVVGALVGAGGSAGIGKIKGLFDDSKGPKPPSSGGSSGSVDAELSLLEQDAQAAERKAAALAQTTAARRSANPAERTLKPPPPVVSGPEPARPGSVAARKPTTTTPSWAQDLNATFTDAIKHLSLAPALGLALVGAFKAPALMRTAAIGIGGMFESAFASIIALISFPIKGLQTTKGKSTSPTVAAAYAGAGLDMDILNLGKGIVSKFVEGVKDGWTFLTTTIKSLFVRLINGVIKQADDFLSHIPGTHPISPIKSGGMGVFMALPADMASGMSRVAAPVHHAVTHHTTHQQVIHKAGDTYNLTIVESRTPRETGDAVLKALSAAAQRKAKHGR